MVALSYEGGQPVTVTQVEIAWQVKAACRGPHAAVFFPPTRPERKDERAGREERAKEICGGCSVRKTCLEYALDIREPHGIWGGLNEAERRAVLAARGL